MARVLIIDDDSMFCEMLAHKIGLLGHEAVYTHSLAQGQTIIGAQAFDVVYLDVRMPDGDGIQWLPRFQETDSKPEVIIMTGAGDPDGAELAIKSGAWDYVKKPSSMQAMTLPLVRALQYRREKDEKALQGDLRLEGLVGGSPAFRQCLDKLAQAAASQAAVLIQGETGTGKELFARAIHENSVRKNHPFVVVDCSSLPQTLVESIIFGHEKGAFTGASEARKGLVAQANGGTLFLDEVGELPLAMQRAFLRVLQEHKFRPIGASNEFHSDFRLVAATNRDLEALVTGGGFRHDLLFRLRSLTIDLPPLRARRSDIEPLTRHHLEKLCSRYNQTAKGVTPEFVEALERYDWPGNVRELMGALEQALAAAGDSPVLYMRHLPQRIRVALARATAQPDGAFLEPNDLSRELSLPPLKQYRREMDRRYFQQLLDICGGDVKRAMEQSGLSRSRFYGLLKDLGLQS